MISFVVYGKPKPQGSMRSFHHKHTGTLVTISDNPGLKSWRGEVTLAAMEHREDRMPPDGPVRLTARFFFATPRKMPKERRGMTTKPDVDKLLRALCDSLSGVLYKDDSQVTEARAVKEYGIPERVEIEVEYL